MIQVSAGAEKLRGKKRKKARKKRSKILKYYEGKCDITMSVIVVIVLVALSTAHAFHNAAMRSSTRSRTNSLQMISGQELFSMSSAFLSDTSIDEEEILNTAGQMSDLPDPIYAVGIAALLFIGVGALQFTLGDLTKEEGQARVRDFLATKKDTERKRGYFD